MIKVTIGYKEMVTGGSQPGRRGRNGHGWVGVVASPSPWASLGQERSTVGWVASPSPWAVFIEYLVICNSGKITITLRKGRVWRGVRRSLPMSLEGSPDLCLVGVWRGLVTCTTPVWKGAWRGSGDPPEPHLIWHHPRGGLQAPSREGPGGGPRCLSGGVPDGSPKGFQTNTKGVPD